MGPKKSFGIKEFTAETLLSQLQEVLIYNPEIEAATKDLKEKLLKENGTKIAVDLLRKLYFHMKPKEAFDQKFGENESPDKCPVCVVEFGLITRKHQCRCCGLVACANCLTPKIPLMNYPEKDDQYACAKCKEKVGNDGKVAVLESNK